MLLYTASPINCIAVKELNGGWLCVDKVVLVQETVDELDKNATTCMKEMWHFQQFLKHLRD